VGKYIGKQPLGRPVRFKIMLNDLL